jgi:lysine 2,3-aminomutase
MKQPSYITDISQIGDLTETEKEELKPVAEKFAFRSNTSYQRLIDWDDPDDPIRKIIIPMGEELVPWGELDASDEGQYMPVPGLEHKYPDTALLLVNDVCGAYCRFCFRKRLFMDDNNEVVRDISLGLQYIREHPSINNVLLTGGDPLIMSSNKLESIIGRVREIDHVRIIRIGTKMPAFNPARIIDDLSLLKIIRQYSTTERKIYMMVHFNHPREIFDDAVRALELLVEAGAVALNQTPIVRGVNDDVMTLLALFNRLSCIGVAPYYVFQCRPTIGNKPFSVPLEEAYDIFIRSQSQCSGLAGRARFIMSHRTGKLEVVGKTDEHIYLRYHRAVNPRDNSRLLVLKRNPDAHWLNDYQEVEELLAPDNGAACSMAFNV